VEGNINDVEVQKLFKNYTNEKKNFVNVSLTFENKIYLIYSSWNRWRSRLWNITKNSQCWFRLVNHISLYKNFYLTIANSYVVHDKNLISELNEYSKRLNFLIENLQSDLSEKNKSMKIKFLLKSIWGYLDKVNLKDHQQQIASEITRARTALSGPLRRKCLMWINS
jgi:hypothetical protein